MKKITWILIILLSLVAFIGCDENNVINQDGSIEILVSKDFGQDRLSNKQINFEEGQTVLDVLNEHHEIETAYGGGFINSIDGLKSGFTNQKNREKIDWFYYVNGILAQVGAGDYEVRTGDSVIWDYHNWDDSTYLSSIIGAYPKNFVQGYNGNKLNMNILYTKGYEKEGKKLQKYLDNHGGEDIQVLAISEEALKDNTLNTIVIGPWDKLSQYDYIHQLYKNREKTGIFFEIDQQVTALNYSRKQTKTFEKGAAITSVLKDYGDMSTIWLITGNDETFIRKGVECLYENPEKIEGWFSALITENDWMTLPMSE